MKANVTDAGNAGRYGLARAQVQLFGKVEFTVEAIIYGIQHHFTATRQHGYQVGVVKVGFGRLFDEPVPEWNAKGTTDGSHGQRHAFAIALAGLEQVAG